MRSIQLPLFWKFTVIVVIVVFVYGAINIFLLWNSVYTSFEKEIDKRCVVLSNLVAQKALSPIVYNEHANLHRLLDEVKDSDPDIAYIFILDAQGNLLAKTYGINIPAELIMKNKIKSQASNIMVINTKNYKHKVIRDIAYPVMKGELGTVRLGLIEADIKKELIVATRKLIIMITVFLIFGLGGALFFSYLITSPIKAISNKAQIVDLDSIKTEDYEVKRTKFKRIFGIYFHDELDILILKFSEMLSRLKINIEELQKTRSSLIQSEKLAAIGTLSAGIAHEINNPLAGIKNCINRISKAPDNVVQTQKYMKLIDEAINKIENVVKHLLDFSRKPDLNFEEVNTAELIENAIQLTSYELEKRNISVVQKMDCTCKVSASRNQLEQVFVNLILNAQDAIETRKEVDDKHMGEIIFDISKHKNKVIIKLIDNGIGIPANSHDEIFNPFFTSKEVGKGTGLGLYVSLNIIKEHHGALNFKSEYGKGTEFVIELPICKN